MQCRVPWPPEPGASRGVSSASCMHPVLSGLLPPSVHSPAEALLACWGRCSVPGHGVHCQGSLLPASTGPAPTAIRVRPRRARCGRRGVGKVCTGLLGRGPAARGLGAGDRKGPICRSTGGGEARHKQVGWWILASHWSQQMVPCGDGGQRWHPPAPLFLADPPWDLL